MKEHEPAPPSPEEVLASVQKSRQRPSRVWAAIGANWEAVMNGLLRVVVIVAIVLCIKACHTEMVKEHRERSLKYVPAKVCPNCNSLEWESGQRLFYDSRCSTCGKRVEPKEVMARQVDGVIELVD